MKRYKTNKLKIIFVAMGIVLLAGGLVFLKINKLNKGIRGHDLKLGIINDRGVELISISQDRRMINILKVGESVPLWLPGDLGWYRANQVGKVIKDKNLPDLRLKLFWYNFGFSPDEVMMDKNEEEWKNNWNLIKKMGVFNWLKYKLNKDRILLKEEKINDDLLKSEPILKEIMSRDFSENQLLNQDLKLSVFNGTEESGLADFVSKRLEWAGFSVMSTDNTTKKVDNCLIIYGSENENNLGWKMIKDNFGCESERDTNLGDDEAELYFGEKFVSMIKYSSYKRSF